MSEHISPKELKRDPLVEGLGHGAEYAASHSRTLWTVIGAAAIVLAVFFGYKFWSNQQAQKAGAAFDDAMKSYQARLRVPGEPEDPGEVTYVVEKIKYEEARKKFDAVAKNYSLTPQGTLARYYSALCSERLDETDKAAADLRSVADGSNLEVGSLAKLALADIAMRTGKMDDAVKILQGLIDHPTSLVPKARAELALAAVYRKTKPAEAAKLYEQVKKDYPDSPLADEADQRLAELGPVS